MLKKTRTYKARETRLLSEWIAKNYPKGRFILNVRLGSLHPRLRGKFYSESEQRMAGVFRRYADGIILLSDRLILIEAAIRPQPGKIAQLKLYERLVGNTPDLSEERHKPVELVLLYAIEDPVLVELAREENIRCIYYRPKWIDEYINEILYPRERTATLTSLE